MLPLGKYRVILSVSIAFKSIVNEALMTAAIELKHQLLLVLKSVTKLVYF